MNAERKFWESVLSAASQDWDVQIDASLGSGALSKQDVRVYVVDVTSGWMSAGGVTTQEMARVATLLSARPEERNRLPAEAPGFIHALTGRKPEPVGPEVKQVVSMALCALTQTRTFTQVQAVHGKLAGHWFYLVCRLQNDNVLGRPAFASSEPQTGLLDAQAIQSTVTRILQADRDSNLGVAELVRQGGGQVLADAFQLHRPVR